MATAVPAGDAGLASVESTAANALAAAFSEAPASSPSPDPTPTPAPPATAAPSPSTEAPPAATPQAPPVGQATAPITIDTNGLSPEARRFLDMKGGNVDRALADALEYNNRLAAVTRGEAPAPGAPAVPPAAPAPGAAPTAPPVVAAPPQAPPATAAVPTKAEIEAHLDTLLGQDPECVRLSSLFAEDVKQVKALDERYGDAQKLDSEIRYLERRMQDADVKDDEVAQADIKEKVRDLKEARAERRELVRHAGETEAQFNQRANGYESRIHASYAGARAKAESDAKVERHAQNLQESWTPAIQHAAKTHNIPADLVPRFEGLCRQAALANLETGFAIEDLSGFMEKQAKELLDIVDVGHRVRAAEYGDKARARADNPGPPADASVATASVPQTNDLNEVYRLTTLRLAGKL